MRTENLLHSFNDLIEIGCSIKRCFCSFVAQGLNLRRKIQNWILKIFFAVTHFKPCMSDSCFLRPLYVAPFLSSWSSHPSKPRVVGHTHILSQYWRELRKAAKHTTQFPGVHPRPSLSTWKSSWLVDGFGPALCSASTSPQVPVCLLLEWQLLRGAGRGGAPDGHLLYFWHTTHVLNEWEAECCTKQKPVRGCRLSQANSYAIEVKGGKTELGRDLKAHFPEAKESWHSAPFNIKEHFAEHMQEY